jgi:hypothetical protein
MKRFYKGSRQSATTGLAHGAVSFDHMEPISAAREKQMNGTCTCGAVAFEAAQPLMRAICHCSICKAYHNKDFADFTIFRTRKFNQTAEGPVTYKAYQQPPILKRGTCDSCSAPILEKLLIPGMPRLMLIPSRWFAQQDELPSPSLHMFYNQRAEDHDDGLPKANGYLPSQWLFTRHLIPKLFKG